MRLMRCIHKLPDLWAVGEGVLPGAARKGDEVLVAGVKGKSGHHVGEMCMDSLLCTLSTDHSD